MAPILRQLHWLPVRQRITFKTAVLVYKCRRGMAPPYLSAYCEPTSSHGGQCHLRSAESGQLNCSTYEDKLRKPQFCRSRASRVEQSSSRPPSAEHFTASVQETTENVPVLG